MDPPRSLSPGACVKRVFIMACLLGSTRCSENDPECCAEIPEYPPDSKKCGNTEPPPHPPPPDCYKIGSTFRYSCTNSFVRRAGTSNLIRCKADKQWTPCNLECIENPLKALQTTTTLKTTTERTSTSFPTSPLTPAFAVSSSVSAETELASTVSPPHLTPGAPFETSALPHTHSNTPSSSPVSSSAPSSSPVSSSALSSSPVSSSALVTTKIFHSTWSLSPPTTTQRSRQLKITPPASFNNPAFFNNTSSTQQEAQAQVTKVIAPVAVGVGVVAVIGAVLFFCRRKSRKDAQREHREPIPEEGVVMLPMENKI